MIGVPKMDGSGRGVRANYNRGGCNTKMKPKGARGVAAVKRLGRNYKTGKFDLIVRTLMKRGYNKEQATKIAAKMYWLKVRQNRGK